MTWSGSLQELFPAANTDQTFPIREALNFSGNITSRSFLKNYSINGYFKIKLLMTRKQLNFAISQVCNLKNWIIACLAWWNFHIKRTTVEFVIITI